MTAITVEELRGWRGRVELEGSLLLTGLDASRVLDVLESVLVRRKRARCPLCSRHITINLKTGRLRRHDDRRPGRIVQGLFFPACKGSGAEGRA